MFIINQDRDVCVPFEKEKIHIFTVVNNNVLWGFNLMSAEIILGTFDTYDEVQEEQEKMFNYDKEFYVVSNYSDYEYEEDDDEETEEGEYTNEEENLDLLADQIIINLYGNINVSIG